MKYTRHSQLVSHYMLQVLQGALPQEFGDLREPSVPDLSDVFGQVRHVIAYAYPRKTRGQQHLPTYSP